MVVQLLAATGKTGELAVRGVEEGQDGTLGMSGGHLVSARWGMDDGPLALGTVFSIDRGDFEFRPADRIDGADLSGAIEELLDRARTERERVRQVHEVVPSDRVRFHLSERASEHGQITLSPAQWRALLLVDGQRDVSQIADALGMGRAAARELLAELVRSGLADTVAAEIPAASMRRAQGVTLAGRMPDFPLETIVQLLAETKKTGVLEVRSGVDASHLGVSDGQLTSAATGSERGELALGAALTVSNGEFEFVPGAAPEADLEGDLDALLDRAMQVRDQLVSVREVIPSERSRFALSDSATGARRLETLVVLADLVRRGYVDVVAAEEMRAEPAPPPPPPPAPEPEPVAEAAPAPEAVWQQSAPAPEPPPPVDDRLSALSGLFGQAEAAPPPPPSAPPAWRPPSWEAAPAAEAPPQDAAAEPEIDPRLAAFGIPVVEPEPRVEPREWRPVTEAAPEPSPGPEAAAEPAITFEPAVPRGPEAPPAPTRAGRLATFVNELVVAYNSGKYGSARIGDRMIDLIMRADEQADPIDRPLPIEDDRLDVTEIDRGALPERQLVPYVATMIRQVYDDAERAFGRDKARKGFKETRDRVFGKDHSPLNSPEVSARIPKV